MSEIDRLHNSDSKRSSICIVGAGIAGMRRAMQSCSKMDSTSQSLKPEVGWEAEYVLPLVWSDYCCTSFLAISTLLSLDMPEQSTRIPGRYVGTSFRLILFPPWFLFPKLTPIFLIRGPQWIHTSGNNPILNIAINSDTPPCTHGMRGSTFTTNQGLWLIMLKQKLFAMSNGRSLKRHFAIAFRIE